MNSKDYYEIIKISDHSYRITSKENVFMDLFIGTQKALLLDTGFGLGDLKSTISSLTNLPIIIVNTHGHYDHANGNFLFKDHQIYMNEADWPVYAYYCSKEMRKHTLDCSKISKKGWDCDECVNILPDDLNEMNYIHAKPSSLIPLNDGMCFDLGGLTLKVIEVPGHTKGSCALLYEEENTLYVGDAANAHLVLTSFNAPLEIYKSTLRRLDMLNFKKMYTSHDKTPLLKEVIKDYMDCAFYPDPKNYLKVRSPFRPDEEDYMYLRRGFAPEDMKKPGFACFITKEKL